MGKVSKVLCKSSANKDLCFSIVAGTTPGGTSTMRGSIDESVSTNTPTGASNLTPPSSTTRRSGFFSLTSKKAAAEPDERESLDIELTAESRIGRDELVAGLKLLGVGTGPMDAAEMMRRTSFSGSVSGSMAGTLREV